MAQTKLNDFYSNKTRTFDDRQSAKRRKLDASTPYVTPTVNLNNNDVKTEQVDKESFSFTASDIKPSRRLSSRSKSNISVEKLTITMPAVPAASSQTTRSSRSSKQSSKSKPKTKSSLRDKSQRKLTDLIDVKTKIELPELSTPLPIECKDEEDIKPKVCADLPAFPSSNSCASEITTSIIDDHDRILNGESTPRKRIIRMDSENDIAPKTRVKKLAPRRLSDENDQVSARKNLDESLSSPVDSTSSPVATDELNSSLECQLKTNPKSNPVEINESSGKSKSELLDLVSSITDPPAAVSPLHRTPERPQNETLTPPKEMSPKLHSLSEKLNGLTNMNTQAKRALKNRLKQSGKLGAAGLKERLNELSGALKKNTVKEVATKPLPEADVAQPSEQPERETEQIQQPPLVADQKSVPYYQRFEHLTKEDVPTLDLPFHYRLLEAAFQVMDHIVSMMHNRSEMCTFSKLKAAVQNATRKNFEEKAVGQIKTIAPNAYDFRQEKNIPTFGKKTSGYQLTIEPRLLVKDENSIKTKEGKPLFSSSMLVSRKQDFKIQLINVVKQHHKTFLSTLNPPMKISDDKVIKRWHPKFRLDQVPDVPAASLPSPPEVLVYNTAKDVLQKQRGKLNPWVEQALSNVADKNKSSEEGSKLKSAPVTTCSSPSSPSMKGIPQFLLDKIRAKEAAKMQESLTRDPAEDNKTRMMGHLPEMIRILRSYFVTEKKPALPLEMVQKKLQESYKSGISMRDVELHLNLLKDLAPELVTEVEVKRGKFIKLDRNVDVQAVNGRIMNMVKARK